MTNSESKPGWKFDNSYCGLSKNFYTKIKPTPVADPRLIIINYDLVKLLGLSLENESEEKLAQIFAGNILPEGAQPLAQAYAGHQFGNFVILGDGRAHLIGEQITPDNKRFDIQLKGSGRTPYSRSGDGRAALGPMLREYVISEAMHALGIPTTRSLAVVTTGEPVLREDVLPGAILTRVAASHIRVGTFQYCLAQGDKNALQELADYTINRHYPEIIHDKNPYLSLLKLVMKKQIELVTDWMRVGFIHGVMNTDNMAVSGETIDYGPCAFMDKYHPATVFSSIDYYGRYAFVNQPAIAKWNLARFAETLLPLLDDDESKAVKLAEATIEHFDDVFKDAWYNMMKSKIGLFGEDEDLVNSLLKIMIESKLDYTNTFYALTYQSSVESSLNILPKAWLNKWRARVGRNEKSLEAALRIMRKSNPVLIPRNHMVEDALRNAYMEDLKPMKKLLAALSRPYEDNEAYSNYKNTPSDNDQYKTFCGT